MVEQMPGNSLGNTRAVERVKGEEGARFQEGTPVVDDDPTSKTFGQKVIKSRLDMYGGPTPPPVIGGPTTRSEAGMKSATGGGGYNNPQAAANINQSIASEIRAAQQALAQTGPGALDPKSRQQMEYQLRDLQAQASGLQASGPTYSPGDPASPTPAALIGPGAAPVRAPGGALPPPSAIVAGGAPATTPAPVIGPRPNVVDLSPAAKRTIAAQDTFSENTAKNDAAKLEQWRTAADAGRNIVATAGRLKQIAASGVFEGGGAQAKTAAASLISGFTGITPKELAGSEMFNAEAADLVMSRIKELGQNPTDSDLKFIKQMVPQIEKSPAARDALIKWMEEKGEATIDRYTRADKWGREKGGLGGFDPELKPAGGAWTPPPGVTITLKEKK
jgi:hypothetical protein